MLDQGIDTSTAVGRMFFQILGSIAEFEHALMSERTLDGLAAARARGRTGGPETQARTAAGRTRPGDVRRDRRRRRRCYTVAQIAAEFGVTRPTIYRHLDRLQLFRKDSVTWQASPPLKHKGGPHGPESGMILRYDNGRR